MSLILEGVDLPKGQSLMVFIANNGKVVCSGEEGVKTTKAIQIPKDHGIIVDMAKWVTEYDKADKEILLEAEA